MPVAVSHMAGLPPEAAVDRSTWEHMGAKSSLIVPIIADSAVSYLIVLGVLREEREWPAEIVPRLRVLGEMMTNAVLRAAGVRVPSDRARRSETPA